MGPKWEKLNHFFYDLSHDYLLLTIGGVLFFAIQAYIGYKTYKHYDRKLTRIENKLTDLLSKMK